MLEAERIYRRAIDISRADNSVERVQPRELNNYAAVLRELSRLPEAADFAERAYAKAEEAGETVTSNQCLLLRVTIYRDQRDLARSDAMLAQSESRLRRVHPVGHYAFAYRAVDPSLNVVVLSDCTGLLH